MPRIVAKSIAILSVAGLDMAMFSLAPGISASPSEDNLWVCGVCKEPEMNYVSFCHSGVPYNCVPAPGISASPSENNLRYHASRSWLHPTKNVLALLEEVGGDPSGISFGTRYVDAVCAHVSQTLIDIARASSPMFFWATHIIHKICKLGKSKWVVQKFHEGLLPCSEFNFNCRKGMPLGKETCSISVSKDLFGISCADNIKSLAAEGVRKYRSNAAARQIVK